MIKFLVSGAMTDTPPPYAPSNYHHPAPTLACLESCLREAFPGIMKLRTADTPGRGNEPSAIAISIEHNYRGHAQALFVKGFIEITKRHIPKTHAQTALILDCVPPIYLTQGDQ